MLDSIIVGLGLAGAAAAFKMELKGKKFHVFDPGRQNASKVAGGVMNPVILKRFTLAWKSNEQLETSKTFYREMEEYLQTSFLSPVEIYRKFASVEEQNNWFEAADNHQLSPFLNTRLHKKVGDGISGSFSFGKLNRTARVHTQVMLSALENKWRTEGKLSQESFQYEDLQLTENGVQYKDLTARNIIFCEGFGVLQNPFFKGIPMVGNKGEYLVIEAPDLQLEVMVKAGVFISPTSNGRFVVGATYNNQDKTMQPSLQAREELEKKLSELITVPYQVVDQKAGIRPTTIDRRPLVGQHPVYPRIFISNGFGSRGVLTAPMAAAALFDLIDHGTAIPSEMDVSRFHKRIRKGLGV